MISALAKASQVLGEHRYLEAAEKASRFIKLEIYDSENKQLYRRWREDDRKVTATASDYAFLVRGFIDLYEASFDVEWLDWAVELTEENKKMFFVPVGFAHGYAVLSEETEALYKCGSVYDPDLEDEILWNDPDLAVEWPVASPNLSERDQKAQTFRQYTENM